MTKQEKVFFGSVTAIICACVVGLFVLMSLGCGDSDHRGAILPTVPAPVSLDAFVTCHDWDGEGPDKEFQRAKVERSENPRFCFIGDVCFYGCPR